MKQIEIFFFYRRKKIAIEFTSQAPRKGDEVRIRRRIYKVDIVVWCYDEKLESSFERVNIGLTKA